MANEQLNNENTDSSLDPQTQSLDESEMTAKDDTEKLGGELSGAQTEAADVLDDTDKKSDDTPIKHEPKNRPRPQGAPRRRPDGSGRRPRPDGKRPRPNGQRPRPDGQRPRPDGQRRRPDGQRPRQGDDPQRRRRPAQSGAAASGSKQGQGKKKKGWTKKKKVVLITVVSIVLTLVLITAVILILFFAYTGKLNRNPDTKVNSGARPIDSSELVSGPDTINQQDELSKLKEMLSKRSEPITNENVMNILIVGEDLRDTASGERGNTDVQLLVSINKEKKKIVLASFLRDQYLDINGYGMGRLNTAYWHEGIPLLKNTIAQYYNIHIDRYILVNFYSFIDVIDSIGGVDMDIDNDEFAAINATIYEQNRYLKNPATKDYIKEPGKQHLNGNQALGYSRIREGCGDDYGRTERQREMLTAVIAKIKGLGLIELDSLINKVAPQITTDLSDGQIASLILNASDIAGYQICQVQMPHFPYFKEEVIDQMAVVVPDYDKCLTLLLDMIYGDSTTVEQAVEKMEAGTINQYTYSAGSYAVPDQNTGGYNDPDTGQFAQ